jgi:Xaa-Pro aminopeptidase
VTRLQAVLQDQGLSAVICFGAHRDYCPADIRYLARWSCTDEEQSFLFVPAEGPSVLITDAEWDVARAKVEARAGEVLLDRSPARSLGRLVAEHAGRGQRVGVSGFAMFPAAVYVSLTERCAGVSFADVTATVAALRLVKSGAEVALLREAARISDLGMRAGIDRIRDGGSEFEVVASAEHAIRLNGAELAFVTVMGAGPRTAQSTFFPTDRPLEAGDLAVLDCGARVHGYHGDMCRTVVVGGGADRHKRAMLDAVSASVRAATEAARPGTRVREVTAAAESAVRDAGFGEHWWGYYMPHGTGTGQHEAPDTHTDGHLRLEPGMVMCVEPGIAVPGTGAVILEQMIHVTASGAETLTQLPLEL